MLYGLRLIYFWVYFCDGDWAEKVCVRNLFLLGSGQEIQMKGNK